MGVAKKTRKFGAVKRVIGQRDARLKKNQDKADEGQKKKEAEGNNVVREMYAFTTSTLYLMSKLTSTAAHKSPPPSSSNTTPPSRPPTPSSSTPTSSLTPSSASCRSSNR